MHKALKSLFGSLLKQEIVFTLFQDRTKLTGVNIGMRAAWLCIFMYRVYGRMYNIKKHRIKPMASPGACEYKESVTNSESPLCSEVGKRILQAEGNVMDAAVATAICVGIVNSSSSGIGGGGFMLVRRLNGGNEELGMIDFRETAPGSIAIAELQNKDEGSREGGMSVATPGEVLGLFEAHKKYGKLPWKRLFEENIAIARGFKAPGILIEKLERNKEYILKDEGLKEIYSRDGKLLRKGDLIRRENYAKTLEIISEDPLSFYTGDIADKIVEIVQKKGGVLSRQDLATYKIRERDVLQSSFRDYKVYTTSLPTSGVLIIEALKILEKVDFDALKKMPKDERMFHLYNVLINVFKAISEKRGELGDPDFMSDPTALITELISEEVAKVAFGKLQISSQQEAEKYHLTAPFVEDHGTTHLEVVDKDEMIVQITSTINLEFGAKFMEPETGIIFNNQIDDFYIPNIKNAYDLPKMPGNIIKSHKRPVSSAAPLLLVKSDEIIVMGATGGSRIPTAMIGTLAHFFAGYGLADAVSSVRMHNQLSPDITYVEKTFPQDIWDRISESGEKLEVSETNSIFTSVQAIQIKKKTFGKRIYAVADFRKNGQPAGL